MVHTAGEYCEVLECVKRHALDLVVLDIQMPVMDGLQLLKLLRRGHPALPIVLLSGFVTQEKRDYALQNGATLVLEKMEALAGFDRIFRARSWRRNRGAEGFKGVMRHMGVIELLQMECLGKKSSVLEIQGPNANGRVYISEGAIIHAECEQEFGPEGAGGNCCGWPEGVPPRAVRAQPDRRTIDEYLGRVAHATRRRRATNRPTTKRRKKQQAENAAAEDGAGQRDQRLEEIVVNFRVERYFYAQWKAKDAERRVRLINLLLLKSADMSKIIPALGRGDRFEINEPTSRVICLLRLECRVFIRLSIRQPANEQMNEHPLPSVAGQRGGLSPSVLACGVAHGSVLRPVQNVFRVVHGAANQGPAAASGGNCIEPAGLSAQRHAHAVGVRARGVPHCPARGRGHRNSRRDANPAGGGWHGEGITGKIRRRRWCAVREDITLARGVRFVPRIAAILTTGDKGSGTWFASRIWAFFTAFTTQICPIFPR